MQAADQAPPGGPITLLRLPGAHPDAVYLESSAGGHWPNDVATYRNLLDRAAVAAPPLQDTPDILTELSRRG